MFWLPALLRCTASKAFYSKRVCELTDLPPDDGTPRMVVLHKDACPHCDRLAPTWNAAADLGFGVSQFCHLDCGVNTTACQILRTEGVPRILYFLDGKIYEYNGQQLARLIVDWAANFLPDKTTRVSMENASAIAENAAFLFTDKEATPKIWCAAQNAFNRTEVPFYVSKDRTLLKQFGQSKYPGIYFKRGCEFVQYKGKMDTRLIVNELGILFGSEKEL